MVTVVFLVSCSQTLVEKPENLIPEETMTEIYYEVALLNAAKGTSSVILENNEVDPQAYLYTKFGIDSLQFAQNSVYYASKPDIHLRMFQEVEKKLNALKEKTEAAFKKESTREKPVIDSISSGDQP